MPGNVPFRCKIGLKAETQWADIVCLVFQNQYYSVWCICINSNSTHTTFRKFMHWARQILCRYNVCNEQQGRHVEPHLQYNLQKFCITSSETQDTRHQPIMLRTSNLFYRNGTFPDMGALSKLYLLSPLYNPQKSVILILRHPIYIYIMIGMIGHAERIIFCEGTCTRKHIVNELYAGECVRP